MRSSLYQALFITSMRRRRSSVRPLVVAALVVVAVLCFGVPSAAAQGMAEYGHVSAGASATTHSLTSTKPANKTPSAHISAPPGEAAEVLNRKALAQSTGSNATLTLKSTPGDISVWVDGKIVGRTPLVLTISPGKHEVEMEGTQTQQAKSQVVLSPLESREIVLQLQPRYPTQIRLRRVTEKRN